MLTVEDLIEHYLIGIGRTQDTYCVETLESLWIRSTARVGNVHRRRKLCAANATRACEGLALRIQALFLLEAALKSFKRTKFYAASALDL